MRGVRDAEGLDAAVAAGRRGASAAVGDDRGYLERYRERRRAVESLVLATADLTIPHPRMAERPFVLTPLAEIAPELVPPGWNRSIGALANVVRGNGDVLVQIGDLSNEQNSA